MIHTGKPSPDTGKVSTDRLTEGASVSRNKRMQTVSCPRLFWCKSKECKPQAVPGHGEGVNRKVDGRGKSEQTRKNK